MANTITIEMADSYFSTSLSKGKWLSYTDAMKTVALFTSEIEIRTELRVPFIFVSDEQLALEVKPDYELMAVYEWALTLLKSDSLLDNLAIADAMGVTSKSVTGLGEETYDLSSKDKMDGPRKRLLKSTKAWVFIRALRGKANLIR